MIQKSREYKSHNRIEIYFFGAKIFDYSSLCFSLAFVLIRLNILNIRKQSKTESNKYAIILSIGYDQKSIIVTDVVKNFIKVFLSCVPCVLIYTIVDVLKKVYSQRLVHTFIPLENIPVWFVALIILAEGVAYVISFSKKTIKFGGKISYFAKLARWF